MEGESNSTVVVDIEKLQSSLISNSSDQHCTSFCNLVAENENPTSICKVQKLIRDVYKTDYEPVVASIGPHHHGKERLRDMEQLKWKSLEYILKTNPEKTLHDYIAALWEMYPVARSYYDADIKIPDSKFVHVLLLDGCFIVAFVCGLEESPSNPDSVPDENLDERVDPLEYSLVTRDALLIENQIPFFIIKRIYELFSSKEIIDTFFTQKLAKFFEETFSGNSRAVIQELKRPWAIYHLLHLCHIYLRPGSEGDNRNHRVDHNRPETNRWQQAIEYHVAGVKLEKRDFDQNNPHSLLDVNFVGDVLQIPYLFVDEMTAAIFRNLIVLEQTNPQFGNHISAYIFFISQLVSSKEDVTLLVNKEIIGHHFESEEVSDIFMSLGECLAFDFSGTHYLRNIHRDLEVYYKPRMKWGIGQLRRAKAATGLLI